MGAVTMWICAIVLFLVVEAVVPGLISIWFAVGALPALLSAALGGPQWLQIALFLGCSIAALVLTRPLAKKYVNDRVKPTNADLAVGKDCVVVEAIDNLQGSGAVTLDGKTWTARTEDETIRLPENSVATVLRIEGVKLIVAPKFGPTQG